MGYVAVKGGKDAIENAERYLDFQRLKGDSPDISTGQISDQLYLAVDRIMGEGSLYAPDLAALAFKQAAGDTFEASFILRAYRTTKPRMGYSMPCDTKKMRIIRRISSAFKDIPGGQILGPTPDYTLKLLNFDLIDMGCKKRKAALKALLKGVKKRGSSGEIGELPKVIDMLRKEGLVVENKKDNKEEPFDVTRESPVFPASRSASLQTMARGETGGLLLLAYSNIRGYGDIHPALGELRVGYMPVMISHPLTGKPYEIGRVKITEAEIIARFNTEGEKPKFSIGYGVCFGHNEVKAISMAILDRSMANSGSKHASEDQEFVLSHIDGIESMGFSVHWKLPHYVTFQSDLDRLRKAQEVSDEKE
jgi:alpha-D-ribose 1-methylphosphonate 5-triphosphate synthase subunit PhnI